MHVNDSDKPDKRYYELSEKWRNGTITPQEEKEFSEWYNSFQDEIVEIPASFATGEDQLKARMWNVIQQPGKETKRFDRMRALAFRLSAAAIIVAVGLSVYYYLQPSVSRKMATQPKAVTPIYVNPGREKATLTLDDGTVVTLEEAGDGTISQQGSTKVIKLAGSKISYLSQQTSKKEPLTFNTVSTPRGGQYEVILPDNTKVWLNAASSLKFPTAFTGNQRQVELSGEGYFEVAKNKSMPFIVIADKMQVTVLGTHFNIMAYREETEVRTTLLEGSVKILKGEANALLKPGQQAQLKEGAIKVLNEVDMEEVMAWKNGEFHFENTDLQTIMRQVERWYDITVTYEGKLSAVNLSGIISRKKEVGQLLEILEATHKVRFRLEGNRIVVAPHSRS